MITDKKRNLPIVIPEDSGPPPTDIKDPKKNPEGEGLDIDDAQIEEPRDEAFKKAPEKQQPLKKRKKTGSSGFD
jgi:hypothetical protein